MSEQPSATDLSELTIKDFANSSWRAVLKDIDKESYASMSNAFSAAANKAFIDSQNTDGRVLQLLAKVCSMKLAPDSRNEPFKPYFQMGDGQRSTIPDDFTETELALFSHAIETIENPRLKARLADLLWLMPSSRQPKFALAAIDSYRLIPLTPDSWVVDAMDCCERAISLSLTLGKGAGNRLLEIETQMINLLHSSSAQNEYFGVRLAETLKSHNLGRKSCR